MTPDTLGQDWSSLSIWMYYPQHSNQKCDQFEAFDDCWVWLIAPHGKQLEAQNVGCFLSNSLIFPFLKNPAVASHQMFSRFIHPSAWAMPIWFYDSSKFVHRQKVELWVLKSRCKGLKMKVWEMHFFYLLVHFRRPLLIKHSISNIFPCNLPTMYTVQGQKLFAISVWLYPQWKKKMSAPLTAEGDR